MDDGSFQVVLPHTGGSHKAGFRLVYSNTKGDFCLDGVFNVISYDVVPKIQSTLLDLDFKVEILSHTSFHLRRMVHMSRCPWKSAIHVPKL